MTGIAPVTCARDGRGAAVTIWRTVAVGRGAVRETEGG
jgi:hypothetical protein